MQWTTAPIGFARGSLGGKLANADSAETTSVGSLVCKIELKLDGFSAFSDRVRQLMVRNHPLPQNPSRTMAMGNDITHNTLVIHTECKPSNELSAYWSTSSNVVHETARNL